MLIQELRSIQDRLGYIPSKEIHALAERLNLPVYEVHGVASFYPHFRLRPPPRATVHVCTDLACHLNGAPALLEQIKTLAGGHRDVEIKACSCLGRCDGAPALLINDHHPAAYQKPDELLDSARSAIAGDPHAHQKFPHAHGPFRSDPYTAPDQHYGALRALVASGRYADVVAQIKSANLRGMGGAGTPAFRKWDTVAKSPADQKYVIANADESEVGTFKDREIMVLLPHLLVEAMVIAGLSVGATKGYIYLRHEYPEQAEVLARELQRARAMGVLGDNLLNTGKSMDIELFISPGGYVQGEETALLEALEGRRGQPRNKERDVGLIQGVPAFTGLFAKPTLINNVETFIYVPSILLNGPQWFIDQGINGCQGLKWVGIGGDVNAPGVFEVPMGTTYTRLIEMADGMRGGKSLKAICPSGPTGGILPPALADAPMDFKAFGPAGEPLNAWAKAGGFASVGSGSVLVLAEGRCLVDAALNFTRFYRNESCGKCVPCRVGSQKMVDIIAGIAQGTAGDHDLAEIDRLAQTLDLTSICGLGQVVPSPIQSVMKYFRGEVEEHLLRKRCPAGVCF